VAIPGAEVVKEVKSDMVLVTLFITIHRKGLPEMTITK